MVGVGEHGPPAAVAREQQRARGVAAAAVALVHSFALVLAALVIGGTADRITPVAVARRS